jgi:thymidylate synthase (FAD)
MDSRFTVEVLSQTSNPQQTIYAAMHQDYAEEFVAHTRETFPGEAEAGDLVIKYLLGGNRGHFGPIEHPQIVLNVGWFPHSCMQQIRTHRVGISFDVQCLAAETEVTFVKTSGALHKVKLGELYDLWTNGEKAVRERKIKGREGEEPGLYRRDCQKRLRRMKLRVLNEETGAFEISHLQDVMCSGTQPVYRLTLEDGKTLDCTSNHRLFTSLGWQHMGDALGLVTDDQHQVLAMTREAEVMCNGVMRPDALYSQKAWFVAQAQQGLTAREIATACNCSTDVVRHWSKQHGVKLQSDRKKGLKTIVGQGLYRDRDWLEAQLNQGRHADEIAEAAGCSIECVKKWVYRHDLSLNKRPTGTQNPWNKNRGGYQLDLSPESRQIRQQNAKQYTKRGAESNFWKGGVSSDRTLIGAWTRQIAPQVHEKFDYICQSCGVRGGELHAHHLVPVFADLALAYEFENLVSVCKDCHETIHGQHLEGAFAQNFQPIVEPAQWQAKPTPNGRKLMAHPVKVVGVEYLGMQKTYDLEVAGKWHNFVANGLVVHNSFRYTGTRILAVATGEVEVDEVFYLRPLGSYTNRQGKKYEYSAEQRAEDQQWCLDGAKLYAKRIAEGCSEEHARSLIPFDVRQHWVMSANVRSLMHLMDLRAKDDAQLEAQQMCELIWPHFEAWVPAIAAWYKKNRWAKARLSP